MRQPKIYKLDVSTTPTPTSTSPTPTSPEPNTTPPPPTTFSPEACLALKNAVDTLKKPKIGGGAGAKNHEGVMPTINIAYGILNESKFLATKISKGTSTISARNSQIDKALTGINNTLNEIKNAKNSYTSVQSTYCATAPAPSFCTIIDSTLTTLSDAKTNLNSVSTKLNNVKGQKGAGKNGDYGGTILNTQLGVLNAQANSIKTALLNLQAAISKGCK